MTWGSLAQDVAGAWSVLVVLRSLWLVCTAWGLEEEIPDPERQIVPGTWVLTDGEDS